MSILIPSLPILDAALDLASLALITILLLLSFFSLALIIQLRIKTRTSPHLLNFNSLWTIRILLVFFITVWSLTEVLRVPFFRRRYMYPFFSTLTLTQQSNICKVHIVLSLGIFQPAFLVILLFLLNVSIKKKNPHDVWAVLSIFGTCLPLLLLQVVFLFFSPFDRPLPEAFERSSVLIRDGLGHDTVLCTYPLFGTIVFGAFGVIYYVCFLVSCCRVVSVVINNGLRIRIYVLACAVLVPLPVQVILMAGSALWRPDQVAYGGSTFAVLVCALMGAVAGEGVLVIRPIADALAAGGDICWWSAGSLTRRPEDGGNAEMVAVARTY